LRAVCCLLLAAAVFMTGCANSPSSEQTVSNNPDTTPAEPVPELTLNLPGEEGDVCADGTPVPMSLLDRGFSALVAGDHIEAVKYFQRYKQQENTAVADWEAGIAIAYDSMLSQSPFFDPGAARDSYRQLEKSQPQVALLHENAIMMRDALATLVAMQMQLGELRKDNATLSADLSKREEAIKRLRELTLGQ